MFFWNRTSLVYSTRPCASSSRWRPLPSSSPTSLSDFRGFWFSHSICQFPTCVYTFCCWMCSLWFSFLFLWVGTYITTFETWWHSPIVFDWVYRFLFPFPWSIHKIFQLSFLNTWLHPPNHHCLRFSTCQPLLNFFYSQILCSTFSLLFLIPSFTVKLLSIPALWVAPPPHSSTVSCSTASVFISSCCWKLDLFECDLWRWYF